MKSGEHRLRAAIARRRRKRSGARLENGQTWLIRVAIGAFAAEIVRIALVAFGLGG